MVDPVVANDGYTYDRKNIEDQNFQHMKRTFPEFKFTSDWNNNWGVSGNHSNIIKKKYIKRKPKYKFDVSTVPKTRLAQAMEFRKTSKMSPKNTFKLLKNRNKNTHLSAISMQTRLKESRINLHFLAEDDSIVMKEIHPSLLNLGDEHKKLQMKKLLLKYNQETKPKLIHSNRKKLKRVKRGIKKFVKRNNKYKQKYFKMLKEHQILANKFNNSQKGSRSPSNMNASDSNSLSRVLMEQSDTDVRSDSLGSHGAGSRDSGSRDSRTLSHRRLRSRSNSAGSTHSIKQATTRLTRAKEQLRNTVAENDRIMMTAGGRGAGRLLGRPMSRSQKIRLSSSAVGSTSTSTSTSTKVIMNGDNNTNRLYSRTIINSNGAAMISEIYEPPTIHTSWLGLAPPNVSVIVDGIDAAFIPISGN